MSTGTAESPFGIRFYCDEHVPSVVVDQLRGRGVDCLTVQQDGRGGLSDSDVLDRAGVLGRVVLTSDAGFARIAHERQRNGAPFAGVVKLNDPSAAVADLLVLAECYGPDDMADRIEYLPL
ncbi:DUF5615 family PIN-like protein [Alienimonas chondri]|uniref:DUF5615 domain-containing protein n=1 Tax=Alienimonas chondri TaxID=2681879 RepID=A0ABX1VE69_9PLAN|nr:DUF5615 family PIN-like protein [Alienimonas chondri]NNJ26088.1 hypothetical protein [Alienimonas chondri]